MLHTSTEKIIKIKDSETFGNFLFYKYGQIKEEPYFMISGAKWVHFYSSKGLDIAEVNSLPYDDDWNEECDQLINEVAEKLDLDPIDAIDYVCELKHDLNFDGWYLQKQAGRLAVALGWDAVEVGDETGISIIVNMSGKTSKALYNDDDAKEFFEFLDSLEDEGLDLTDLTNEEVNKIRIDFGKTQLET